MQYELRNIEITQDNVQVTRVHADIVLVNDDATETVVETAYEMTVATSTVAEMWPEIASALLDVAKLHWQEHNQIPALVEQLTGASWTPPGVA